MIRSKLKYRIVPCFDRGRFNVYEDDSHFPCLTYVSKYTALSYVGSSSYLLDIFD